MDETLILLLLLNLTMIGLLPVIFFQRSGKLNLAWWLTAAPFFAMSLILVFAFAGVLQPIFDFNSKILKAISVIFSSGSIALISYTLGTHRIPLALWHQSNDAPKNIVTFGAYQRIRHPFYTSFILCLIACSAYFIHVATLICLIYGIVILNFTAQKEEKKLLASPFGEEYLNYQKRTGRFFPWR